MATMIDPEELPADDDQPDARELARRALQRAKIASLTYDERRQRIAEIVASDPDIQRLLGIIPDTPTP